VISTELLRNLHQDLNGNRSSAMQVFRLIPIKISNDDRNHRDEKGGKDTSRLCLDFQVYASGAESSLFFGLAF